MTRIKSNRALVKQRELVWSLTKALQYERAYSRALEKLAWRNCDQDPKHVAGVKRAATNRENFRKEKP